MLFPSKKVKLQKLTGFNVYGEPSLGAPYYALCNIIRMDIQNQHTAVRTDASASRSNAREDRILSTMLFPPGTDLVEDSKCTVDGIELKIRGIHYRWDVNSVFDHFEVDLEIWA